MNNFFQRIAFGLILVLASSGALQAQITGLTGVCKNSTANYTAPPLTGGQTVIWSLTPAIGNIANLYGPSTSIQWPTSGIAMLTLNIKSSAGVIVQTFNQNITIGSLPQPTITSNYRVGCQRFIEPSDVPVEPGSPPSPTPLFDDDEGCVKACEYSWVTYTAVGAVGSTYTWTVSGGQAYPSGSTCVVQWGSVGLGSVTVNETTAAPTNCQGSRTMCVNIIPKPHASFGAMPDTLLPMITICEGSNVQFVDHSYITSSSPIENYYWDFGDGQTFSSRASTNPTHTYPNPGNYTVTLVVKNACNCTDTMTMIVDVFPGQGVKIECASVVCENAPAIYELQNGASIPCTMYDWSVIGGTITSPPPYSSSVMINWDNVDDDGFGYVIFDPSTCGVGCPAKTAVKIPVIKATGKIKGTINLCANTQYKYTLPAWPGTVYNWYLSNPSFGTLTLSDQPNEIIVTSNNIGGLATLHCDYSNSVANCTGNAEIDLETVSPDFIMGDLKACHNSTVNYSTIGGNAADWTLIDPNNVSTTYSSTSSVTITFSTVGTYSLAIEGKFCSPAPVLIRVFKLPAPPDKIDGPDTVCADVPYEFTVGNAEPGTIFNWTAQNGTIQGSSSGKRVTAVFTGTGAYSISAVRTLSDTPFCTSPVLTKTLLRPVVTPNVTGSSLVCPNTVEHYSAGYTHGESYEWTIGNPLLGSIDDNKQKEINVTWNNQTVTTTTTLLLKITRCNQDYYQTYSVTIQGKPSYTLTAPTSICRNAPFNVILAASPSLTSGTVTWSVPGALTPGPLPVLPSSNLTAPYKLTEINTGDLLKDISVIITNPNGCPGTDVVTTQVLLMPSPVALVSPQGPLSFCNGVVPPTVLTATIQSGPAGTTTLAWERNSVGIVCTGPNPPCNPQTVSTFGDYVVVATGANGCSDRSNIVHIDSNGCGNFPCAISPEPIIKLIIGQDCGHVKAVAVYGATNILTTTAYYTPPSATNVVTHAGTPGNNSDPASIDADMPVAGEYDFGFTWYYQDVNGQPCKREYGKKVIVPLVPKLLYELTCQNSVGYSLTLVDNTTFYPGAVITSREYQVDGGGYVTGGNNLAYGIIGIGSHLLELKVVYTWMGNTYTCFSKQNITVLPLPVASFTVVGPIVPACAGKQSIQFQNTSTGANSYFWDFDDFSYNKLAGFAPNLTKTYSGAGFMDVMLTVSNGFGCADTVEHTVQVEPFRLEGTFSASPSSICEGSVSTLTYTAAMSSTQPTRYDWMNDVKHFFTTVAPVNSITTGQSGNYWVHLTDQYGCWANEPHTIRRPVTVIAVPDPIISGDSLQCVGNTFTLNGFAGSDPSLSYAWTRNSAAAGTGPMLVQTGLSAGTYSYVLTITSTSGATSCSKSSSVFKVVVHAPGPAPALSFSVLACNPYSIQLDAAPALPNGTYTWSNGSTGNPNIVQTGGQYRVWYTDDFGCITKADLYTPRDPAGYLWIFPTGCYTYCPPIDIPAPIIPFAAWNHYDVNGPSILQSGSFGIPASFNPPGTGDYGMTLDNSYCVVSIDTLHLTLDCNGGGGGGKASNPSNAPGGTQGSNSRGLVKLANANMEAYLNAAPNPAKHSVRIAYGYTQNAAVASDARSVDLYDMTGRFVVSHKPTAASGTWQLSLDGIAAGIYQVLMKDNGHTIATIKLSVQH